MPTTKPEPYKCGTAAPIWMQGAHPTNKGDVVNVKACTNVNNRRNGCSIPHQMSVKHCGTFFVYYLKPSIGCAMAYCAGDLQPCPRGQIGIVPKCTGSVITPFPYRLVPTPTVTYLDNNQPLVRMLCKFQFPVWQNVSFAVEWFTDGYSVFNETVCNDQSDDEEGPACQIRQSELIFGKFQPGHRVRCRLRMRYTTHPNNKWTFLWRQSNDFFVGIEIKPLSALVTECKKDASATVTLSFRPTVPVNPDDFSQLDYVPISVFVPKKFDKYQKQSAVDKCELQLKTSDIKHGKTLKIRGLCDNQDEPTVTLEYNFAIQNTHSFWGLYRLPSVRVTVSNTPTALCRSTGDPHYMTFDKKYYDFYEPGDYVLYSNPRRQLEIHSRLWTCWSVSCNCGIAIRERNDVIVVTACNEQLKKAPGLLRTNVRSRGALARGTHIYRHVDGSSITHNVVLPSGTRVKVTRSAHGLEVFLNAPGADASNTAGLCGDFDGNQNNDYSKGGDGTAYTDGTSFARSWRVTPDKSYFEILPPRVQITEEGQSCTCPVGDSNIVGDCKDDSNRFQFFGPETGEDIAKKQQERRRRSVNEIYTDDIMDNEERSFFANDQEIQFAFARMRTKRDVMSENEAEQYCKSTIEDSVAGKICSSVPGTNLTVAMQSCITDLKITGDKGFAISAFDSMKEGCEEVALKNISLFTEDADGQLKPPAEIGANLCPNHCSNHGNCTSRTCICEEGFTAADCSMLINAVPELFGIYDKGLCDIRRRPCKKTDIFGKSFISSENLTCHVEEFKVVSSNWTPNAHSVKFAGKMIDIFGVRCELPDPPTKLGDYDNEGTPAGGLLITISNNGQHRSRRVRSVSYDSVCMACSNSSNCELKNDSCLISGHCFAANQSNPRDWCQQCMPGHARSTWTQRKVNHPPVFAKNQSTRYAIQGEHLALQLKATDPDNRPVKYSLLSSTAIGYAFSRTGLLTWNVTSQHNKDFTVKVTDECNATDTMTVTVRIVVCPCQHGGKCSPHPYYPRGSGQYSCTCPLGFGGDRCQENIDECVTANCGNGTCIDGVNNHTCSCHNGFAGSMCDQMVFSCTNETCYPGVNCTEVGNRVTCGSCPVGFSGDGKTCIVLKTKTTTQSTTEHVTTTQQITTLSTTLETVQTSKPATTTVTAPTTETNFTEATNTTQLPPSLGSMTDTEKPSTGFILTTTGKQETTKEIPKEYVKLQCEIRILLDWNDDYNDKLSSAFITLAGQLKKGIWEAYKQRNNTEKLKNVTVTSFRSGSVISVFELVVVNESTDPLHTIKSQIKDSKLGSLEVEPKSLRVKPENTEASTDKEEKDNVVLIIVLVFVGIVIVLVVVGLFVLYKRRKNRNMNITKQTQEGTAGETMPLNEINAT